jgi:hypothetical protein
LDWAILELEKCLQVTHKQRQACEDEDDKYQVVHIVNGNLKDAKDKHKEILEDKQ